MEKITDMNYALTDNQVVGEPSIENSTITFNGKGNVLYCGKGVRLINSTINFMGNFALIFLLANKGGYRLGASISNNSIIYIGNNNYMNGKLNIIASERQNVMIGDEGLFSFDCWIRTADPHLVYDCNSFERINHSKSVFLGDHIWVGQHAYILKGSMIGSGSVIGAAAITSGKIYNSNTIYAGNPAKCIRSDIFFTGDSVHNYTEDDTNRTSKNKNTKFIYSYQEGETLSMIEIDKLLKGHKNNVDEKIKWIEKNLMAVNKKNRFFTKNNPTQKKLPFFKKNKN